MLYPQALHVLHPPSNIKGSPHSGHFAIVVVITVWLFDFNSKVSSDITLVAKWETGIDDVDGYDGLVFNHWYVDMCRTGIAIDGEEIL